MCALWVHSQPPPRPGEGTQGLLCTGHRRWGSLSASAPSRRLCLGKAGQQVPYALRSCQRQAHSLRRWLELSREEPQPEDQEAEQQVQEELRKVRHGRPGGLRGGASSQPAPCPSGGGADPAAGPRAAGPAPACPHLHRSGPGPAAGSVLVTTSRNRMQSGNVF